MMLGSGDSDKIKKYLAYSLIEPRLGGEITFKIMFPINQKYRGCKPVAQEQLHLTLKCILFGLPHIIMIKKTYYQLSKIGILYTKIQIRLKNQKIR